MDNEDLKLILGRLENLRDKLIEINNQTGGTSRSSAMRKEILTLGWEFILRKYHPDVNTEDPAAYELFQMYKFIYDDMKKKNEI